MSKYLSNIKKAEFFFRTYLHFFAVTGQMHQEKETVGSYQVETC